ncbi:MAG: bifunctional 3,4-dihydroxy-2-butanone-4-phosphate synthase/GTP cyclohydrolase II [Candidatus Omnitrophica bacterium]|nr:bifunctional 3,4-dihydroxy-2-butanone-4-phosphate synthase/GTP cyclohydrolase II [Candidatus Omnitrophota bacterium]
MFNTIEEVLEDLRQGKMIVVMDDEGRENEGDLLCAAQFITADKVNFLAKYARGLICVPMEESRLDELKLHAMRIDVNQEHLKDDTAWAISVDAAKGVTTGISAADRAQTVKTLIDPASKTSDLVTPGHLFPLRAKKGGVLVRAGHTEASVDLTRLAGLYPAGVICEIMNEDGTMARNPELKAFSKTHHLKICTIDSLIEYLRKSVKLVDRIVETKLPTEFGEFKMIAYKSRIDDLEHIALVMGKIDATVPTLVRVQSECLTGDVFNSLRCDCNAQLRESMKMISENGSGVFVYMRQEGRGIGLINKLKAYNLQDEGLDTVEANEKLGFSPDLRHYGLGAQILADLGVKQIRLMTNNPRKIVGLDGYGMSMIERVPLKIPHNQINKGYLKAKRDKLGHIL